MVFQDGHVYVNMNGDLRVPIVFDNLIHAGDAGNHRHLRQPRTRRRRTGEAAGATAASNTTRPATSTQVPARGNPSRGRQDVQTHRRPGVPRHLRQQRRHLRLHRGLGAARRLPQGREPHRQLHQHPRRPRLPVPHSAEPNKPIRVFLQDGDKDLDNAGATGGWRTCRWGGLDFAV